MRLMAHISKTIMKHSIFMLKPPVWDRRLNQQPSHVNGWLKNLHYGRHAKEAVVHGLVGIAQDARVGIFVNCRRSSGGAVVRSCGTNRHRRLVGLPVSELATGECRIPPGRRGGTERRALCGAGR